MADPLYGPLGPFRPDLGGQTTVGGSAGASPSRLVFATDNGDAHTHDAERRATMYPSLGPCVILMSEDCASIVYVSTRVR